MSILKKEKTPKKINYIVFEGIVGVGKTTISKMVYDYYRSKFINNANNARKKNELDTYTKVLWTREPGGDPVADKIRETVQATKYPVAMDPICDAYLYAASRAQTLRTIVKPVLDQNGLVITDRSFITSMAYQSELIGLEKVFEINKVAIANLMPGLVVYLHNNIEESLNRTFDHSGDKWENENKEFFEKVHNNYMKASQLSILKDKWVNIEVIDGVESMFNKTINILDKYIY